MELRRLRYFLAVAEELHFARAAERLHVDQSALSRAIKELEEGLGVPLFIRTTRSTQLTRAGQALLDHVPRIFTALEQARDIVTSAECGFSGLLRVALSDGVTPSRLSALLAHFREEDPDVEVKLYEVPLSQQVRGLRDDLYDVGFTMDDNVGEGIVVTPAWEDELMVVLPARHPLLAHKHVPLDEVLRYPLVQGDPSVCAGYARQIDRILCRREREPLIVQRVTSYDMALTLVSAGIALGFAGATHIASSRQPGVVARSLAGKPPTLTTYLLRRDAAPFDALARFIERVVTLGAAGEDTLGDAP